jgi:non-specific serine/threonine protein kinase
MGTLATQQVAERLEDSLGLLSAGTRTVSPRRRTMRDTIGWSYGLLPERERGTFDRHSVFAGGFTLEAAEAVCPGGHIEQGEVLDLLSHLVDKSLVVAEASLGGRVRYRMLEPVRQYGLERLEESGQPEQTRERHARYYLELVEAAEPALMGPRPVECLERLESEQDNLRAALSWSLDVDAKSEDRTEVGLRIAAALGRFWEAYSPSEGRRWLEKGLRSSRAAPAPVRAKALNEAGLIAVYELDPRGMALLEAALALYKELGDRSGMGVSISNMGHAVIHLGDRERMVSLRQEVQALLSEPLEGRVRAHLLFFLAYAAGSEMDFEQMEARLEEALNLYREVGDTRNVATCLPSIGMIYLMREDHGRAAPLFEEGLLLQRDLKHKTVIHFGLAGVAGVSALRGQAARAAKLMGPPRPCGRTSASRLRPNPAPTTITRGTLAPPAPDSARQPSTRHGPKGEPCPWKWLSSTP